MRRLKTLVSLLPLLGCPAVAHAMTPDRSHDLLASLGVNVHIAYTDTAYGDIARVQRLLTYVGIRQVRNLLQSQSVDPAANIHLRRLAATGICRFDFTSKDPQIDHVKAWLDDFAGRFPGAIFAIEGPNEVNHWPVVFDGQSGRAAAIEYQAALYHMVHSDPALRGVVVYGLTGVAGFMSSDLSDRMDFANEHPYARNGAPPAHHLLKELAATHQEVAPSRPMVATETGYPTLVGHNEIKLGADGVSQSVQARYILDLLLDFRKAGIQKTFLYELLDEKPDPDGKAIERHYGLFGFDGTPKLAATALHHFTTILADTGPHATDFTPHALNLSVSGVPEAQTMLLEKSDGTFQLVVWAEPPIWSSRKSQELPPQATQLQVDFNQPVRQVRRDDPIDADGGPLAVSGTQTRFSVTDHPVIVSFRVD